MDLTPLKKIIIKATERAGFFYDSKHENDICVWMTKHKRTGELVFELNMESDKIIFVGLNGSIHEFTRATIEKDPAGVVTSLRIFCLGSIQRRVQGQDDDPNKTFFAGIRK